jgi:hypothetical protein
MDGPGLDTSHQGAEEKDSPDDADSSRVTKPRTDEDKHVFNRTPPNDNLANSSSYHRISEGDIVEFRKELKQSPSLTEAARTGDPDEGVDRHSGTGRAFDRHFIPSVITPWSRAYSDVKQLEPRPLPTAEEDKRPQKLLLPQQWGTYLRNSKCKLLTIKRKVLSRTVRKLDRQQEKDKPDNEEQPEQIYSIHAQPKTANSVRRIQAPRTEMAAQQDFSKLLLDTLPANQGSSSDTRGTRSVVGTLSSSIQRSFEKTPISSSLTQDVRSADRVCYPDVHAPQPPLKNIRLLKLLSPTDYMIRNVTGTDRRPRYSAKNFPYTGCPAYIALSYVWGEENLTNTICINGEDVQVRTNLAKALSTVRESDPEAYLWADAICINQQDEKEKSKLVQHMGEIFANAKLVYAWLGSVEKATQDTTSDDLFLHFSDLGTLFWKHADSGEAGKLNGRSLNFNSILAKSLDALFSRFTQPAGKQGNFPTEEYSKFSQRPYWSRTWVLQEVYYAKELHYICGNSRLLSEKLQGALILLETFQRYLLCAQGHIYRQLESNSLLKRFVFGCPSFPEMHRLIIYTSIYPQDVISLRIAMTNFCVKELPWGSKATDPKDMIYGLIGFANNEEKSYIRADYSKSVQENYIISTRSMMRNGFTDVLAWAQPETKGIAHLPSWVPDYRSTIHESLCSQGQAKAWLPQFRACGETRFNDDTAQPIDAHVLSVHGRRVSEVLRVGQLWFPRLSAGNPSSSTAAEALATRSASYDELLYFLTEVRTLASLAGEMHSRHAATGQSDGRTAPPIHDSMWRVPCCDQIVINSRLVRHCPSTQSLYDATLSGLQACVRGPGKDLPSQTRPYVEALLRWVNKRPLITAKGFVGLGPACAQPGDILVVLDGFNTCYVLRSLRTQELGQYQLIGEAYIDGIMDGEMACSMVDTGEWFHLI